MKCPFCNNEEFITGFIKGKFELKFCTDDDSWIDKNTVLGGSNIQAKQCSKRGFTALFAKIEK